MIFIRFSILLIFNRKHFIRRALDRCLQNEGTIVEHRLRKADGRQFPAHSIDAFAVFFHIAIVLQKCGDLRISGEMRVSDILLFHHSRKRAGAVHFQAIVKHLDLYIRSLDSIIAMCGGVHHYLCANELVILLLRDKDAVMSKIGFLLHLDFDELDGLFYLFKNTPLKYLVFDDIHILTNLRLCSIITDKTDIGTRKE